MCSAALEDGQLTVLSVIGAFDFLLEDVAHDMDSPPAKIPKRAA